jgi:hypothetical protein
MLGKYVGFLRRFVLRERKILVSLALDPLLWRGISNLRSGADCGNGENIVHSLRIHAMCSVVLLLVG